MIHIEDDILHFQQTGFLKCLLYDRTTKKNIIWGTDAHAALGESFARDKEIRTDLITGDYIGVIRTRAAKAYAQQNDRTRKHGEVFTPLEICRKMNDYADEVWFGRESVFDTGAEEKVRFTKRKKWTRYVDSRRLEITCGEAPYLVSRYDVATGEEIPAESRIGILDRKLRVVAENTDNEEDWLFWAYRALEATYGYEFQGDNVLIARLNIAMTFVESLRKLWKREPDYGEYLRLVRIVTWNIWQMDGLTGRIPYLRAPEEETQEELSSYLDDVPGRETDNQPECRIYDWRAGNSRVYRKLKRPSDITNTERASRMKFDFIIGNPPYQEENENNGRKPPIYHLFMDEAYKVADKVELITPARFLFNAGQTPKAWNNKMLNDEHFKVIFYEAEGTKIFPNTDIKGGIVISYRDNNSNFGAVGTFTAFPELNSILDKVKRRLEGSLEDITVGAVPYRFTEKMKEAFPGIEQETGKSFDLRTNILDNLNEKIFFEECPDDRNAYIQIFGLYKKKRAYRWIRSDYVSTPSNFYKWKIFIPEANGSGAIGEVLSSPLIGQPLVGHTQTFISMGDYETKEEAEAILSYIKTKFVRALLGVLKVTQHNPKTVWKYVPLQDFTSSSDIDWSVSVAEIDRQLYKKYGLDDSEIEFIETHVKEMV